MIKAGPDRVGALDWLRGLVMVLMTSDHAAIWFYRDRYSADGAMLPGFDAPLQTEAFLHRWVSHLCAPTFVFLAGTAIALSTVRRRSEGRPIARDLALRGALLIGVDVVLLSPLIAWPETFWVVLQVLFAIGAGMVALAGLHRLGALGSTIAGLAMVVGHEALAFAVTDGFTAQPSLPTAALLSGGFVHPAVLAIYPAIPWLGVMLLGHGLGRALVAGRRIEPLAICGGALGIGTWCLVEALDGYGNYRMTGLDDSWLRWLQTSKYPPSLGFVGLELGLALWILAARCRFERASPRHAEPSGLLHLLGRTALCYYLLHLALLSAVGLTLTTLLPREVVTGGILRVWLAVAATIVLLVPLCRRFLAAKRARPHSWLRFI